MRYLFILILLPLCSLAKKNILFISVDDLKPSLGVYGDNYAITPHIDKLASFGTTFTNAHVQQAICAPSRVSLLTGLRPDLTEVWDLETQMRDKNPNILTLPQYFKENGYSTVGMGKIFDNRSVDRKLDQRSWSQPYIKVEVNHSIHGNSITGFQSPENKKILTQIRDKASEDGIPQGRMWQYLRSKFKPSIESFDISDDGYTDGVITLAAVSQLSKLSEKDDPFFLAVGFVKPHLPFVAPKKYLDMYPISNIKLTEIKKHPLNGYNKAIRTGGELKSYYGMPEFYNEIDDSLALKLRRAYYACISYADAQVGKLLDKLNELDIRDKTIVVLWGDHGYKLGDYNSWCKWTNMHLDTNIPLIFSIPNGKKNSVSRSPIAALDIYPTLVELNGMQKPKHLEGQSIVSLLNNPDIFKERVVYSIWPISRQDYKKTIMGYAAKTERYNYIEWIRMNSGHKVGMEFFDRLKDPYETVNLVEDSQYTETIAFLSEKLSERINNTDHNHAFKKID